VGNFFDRFQRA